MIISIYNHKGGTGKTTSTVNLGFGIAEHGYKVLLIDLDPQANLTYSLGQQATVSPFPITLDKIIQISDKVSLLPRATIASFGDTSIFKNRFDLSEELDKISNDYDYILIDCPPAKTIDVANAIIVSQYVIIPSLLDVLSIEGLRQAIESINYLLENESLHTEILGVLPVMVNKNRNLSREVEQFIEHNYKVNIFKNKINVSVKLAEAPSFGNSIFEYSPKSQAAEQYKNVSKEIINKTKQLKKV